jgi:hypothetical protein
MKLPKWNIPCEECKSSGDDIFTFTWYEWGHDPVVKCECFVCGHEWEMSESEKDEFRDGWVEFD